MNADATDTPQAAPAVGAQVDLPVRPLRRGVDGVCTRSACECEREGLGDQCIWLAPVKVVGKVTIAQGRNAGTYNLVEPKTHSQRMREAGFTRRPTWRSLPSDE